MPRYAHSPMLLYYASYLSPLNDISYAMHCICYISIDYFFAFGFLYNSLIVQTIGVLILLPFACESNPNNNSTCLSCYSSSLRIHSCPIVSQSQKREGDFHAPAHLYSELVAVCHCSAIRIVLYLFTKVLQVPCKHLLLLLASLHL